MNKAYERETEMWNQVFKECTPVDLRTLDLQVETMFDEALKLFAQKTTNVLDFGCGTGDISFQYLQYQPTHKVLGIDAIFPSLHQRALSVCYKQSLHGEKKKSALFEKRC